MTIIALISFYSSELEFSWDAFTRYILVDLIYKLQFTQKV